MKFCVLTAIGFIMIMGSRALPTPDEKDTSPSPLRQAVQYHMKIYLNRSEEIVSQALKRIPNTAGFKESRQILNEFLRHVELYRSKYENCDWNLINFNKDLRTVLNFFGNVNATPEVKDILKFLVDNGLKEVKDQCHVYVRQFLNGELGSEKDINEDFC